MKHIFENRKKYSKINKNWVDSNQIFYQLVKKETNKNTKILDIGCGNSQLLRPIYYDNLNVYGIDPDKEKISKNKIIKHLKVAKGEKLPFKNNFFDLIVFVWVFEHLENPEKVISEAYRVLKKRR